MYYFRDEYSQQQIFVWEVERHKGKLTKEAKHETVDEIAAKIDAVHLYGWHILIVLSQVADCF